MSIRDDKSVQEGYCTTEGAHDLAVSSDHIAVSPLVSEPESRLSEKTSNDWKFFNVRIPSRILSLCGGNQLAIVHMGVLKALHERNLLSSIKGVIGISSGALVGLAYVLGYTLNEIERLLLYCDLSLFTTFELDSALFFHQTLCINSGDLLTRFITSLLETKGYSASTTFSDLPKGIFFRCYATRLETSHIQEFSLEKTPNHPVLFAVRASTCVPSIFSPMKDPFSNTLYYDAVLINNMPFVFLTEEEKRQTLSVFFNVFSEDPLEYEVTSIFNYVTKTLFSQRDLYYLNRYKDNMLNIRVDPVRMYSCATLEEKHELIRQGYSKCLRFLDTRSIVRVMRRYSVS